MPFGCSYSRVAAVLYVPILFKRATVAAFKFSIGEQRLPNVMWHDYEPSMHHRSSSCAVATVMLRIWMRALFGTWIVRNGIPEHSSVLYAVPLLLLSCFSNPMDLFDMWGYFRNLVRFNATSFSPFFSHSFWPCSHICCDLMLCFLWCFQGDVGPPGPPGPVSTMSEWELIL